MTNTKDIIIAERYSDALVEIAKEGKLTYEKISDDLTTIKNTLAQSQDLKEFLTNPIISIENKKEIIEKIFSTELDSLIINFIKVLIDKDRFSTFNEICEAFGKSMDDAKNISRIQVTSAVQMTDETKNRLKTKLETKLNKNVILDLSVDSAIIAGLVIKMGDNILDMSLKHKLEDLSRSITR